MAQVCADRFAVSQRFGWPVALPCQEAKFKYRFGCALLGAARDLPDAVPDSRLYRTSTLDHLHSGPQKHLGHGACFQHALISDEKCWETMSALEGFARRTTTRLAMFRVPLSHGLVNVLMSR